MQLTEWSDISCFKQFCLDRLALGLSAESIASDVSAFVGRVIPMEQVVESCSNDEILDRRRVLLDEVRASAPVITSELMGVLTKIKSFINIAEEKFNSESELNLKDFDTYRKALELKLKAIDVAAKQLASLSESTKQTPNIIINFDFSKLKNLEDEGLIKIIDVDAVKELIGDGEKE